MSRDTNDQTKLWAAMDVLLARAAALRLEATALEDQAQKLNRLAADIEDGRGL